MTIELSENYFESLYDRAKESFYACIRLKENKFLEEEISGTFESLILENKSVEIVFSKNILDSYVLKITLTIILAKDEVGKYTYSENTGGIPMEDSLSFY